jgi:hypothetical protein
VRLVLRVRVLGPLEVLTAAGAPVRLGTPKRRTVCALLALRADQLVTVDELVDELWSERPPVSAVANVRSYAANPRRLLTADGTDGGARPEGGLHAAGTAEPLRPGDVPAGGARRPRRAHARRSSRRGRPVRRRGWRCGAASRCKTWRFATPTTMAAASRTRVPTKHSATLRSAS